MSSFYRRSEVVFLLSLTRDQAIDLDAVPRDSCSDLVGTDEVITKSADESDHLPVIARWVDVQRARQKVVGDKEAIAIAQLRAGGFSESELARLVGEDRLAVRRRWHASVDEILEYLGGAQPEASQSGSGVNMCLTCGERPRARLAEVRVRVKGGWRVDAGARQAAVCEECLTPDLVYRIEAKVPQAA